MLNSTYKKTRYLAPALLVCLFLMVSLPVAAFGDEEEKKAGSPADLNTMDLANGVRDPNIYMVSPLSYSIDEYDYSLVIQVEQVTNTNASGTSGTLKLFLYASRDYYSGGTLIGYNLGGLLLGELPAGYVYNNINELVDYYPPPYGTYWMVLILTETDAYGDDLIIDYFVFNDQEVLGWTSGGGGGDSGGGGGCFIESISRKTPLSHVLSQTGHTERSSQ